MNAAYFNLKDLLIRQGWREDAAKLEAYRIVFKVKEAT